MEKQGLKVDNCFTTDFSSVPPDGMLKKLKHSVRNFFYSASQHEIISRSSTVLRVFAMKQLCFV